MGRFAVAVELTNAEDMVLAKYGRIAPEQVRRLTTSGVVDTGANYLVVPKKIATKLGLPEGGKLTVQYADRRKARRTVVENVRVDLLGRHGIFKAIVEPARKDALIGAIVLEDLDLLADCSTQTLRPRDPRGIIAELE